MAVAKIITEGNTQTIILPEGCLFFDCDEAEVEKVGSEIRLSPKTKTEPEEYEFDTYEDIKELSDELIRQNHEAYTELAK